MGMSRSGFAKRASTWEACAVRGVRARFLVGRLERGSAEVGMDSGIGSDMVGGRSECSIASVEEADARVARGY